MLLLLNKINKTWFYWSDVRHEQQISDNKKAYVKQKSYLLQLCSQVSLNADRAIETVIHLALIPFICLIHLVKSETRLHLHIITFANNIYMLCYHSPYMKSNIFTNYKSPCEESLGR